MRTSFFRNLLIVALLLMPLVGCDVVDRAPLPSPAAPPTRLVPTLFPTAARTPPSEPPLAALTPPASAATAIPDTGWLSGSPGVELRRLRVAEPPERPAIPVTIVRIDPAAVQLRVAYVPDQPRALRLWFADAHPLAAINGGFFGEDYQTTALVISDGVVSGTSYQGFGGMLAIRQGGQVTIRPLRDQAYDPAEPFEQAIQSFPMLIFPGGATAQIEDNGERARRSAVAIDRAGRLLLIACPTSDFTLRGLADWLSRGDLEIDRALNLDGGSSTGLFVADGPLHEEIDSFGKLPIVLMVEPQ